MMNHKGSDINPKVLNVLAKQQNQLASQSPDGVIFQMNADGDVQDIQADIIGPVGTAYEGGVFRMKLVIDSEFPQKPPKGFFLTKIFHPNVAQPSGEICVNTLKKDWNPSSWSLSHIFEVVKCLLIVPFPESSLNEEAGRQFMEDYEQFFSHAKLYTGVHAKPNANQLKNMEAHYNKTNKEEMKREDDQNTYMGSGPQVSQGFQGKEFSVLSQVTNSFVPNVMEGKGELFGLNNGSMNGIPQGIPQSNVQKQAPKKATAAADSKKKWMRRI